MVRMPESVAVNTDGAMECGDCGVEERLLLHKVGQRGTFRRLCTACVLRLHPQSFCPTCFQVYTSPPPNDAVFTCVKCYSISHNRCVAEGKNPLTKPYICPLCAVPNAQIFKLKIAKEISFETVENCRVMDADAAKKLLAAAKIASLSMNKAAAAARVEVERRAKEAAFTRKRARDALEHVSYLVRKDKLRKKESSSSPAAVGAIVVHSGQNLNPETIENGNAEQLPNGTSSSVCLETEKSTLLPSDQSREDEKVDELAAAVGELGGESDDEGDECEALIITKMEDVGGRLATGMNNGSSSIDSMVSNDAQNVSMEPK